METFSGDITTIGAALGIHADNPALERTYCMELGVLIREQKSLLDINRTIPVKINATHYIVFTARNYVKCCMYILPTFTTAEWSGYYYVQFVDKQSENEVK